MRLTIPEILKLVAQARTHEQKVQLLRQHQAEVLEQVLQYNYHPDIEFNLPEGDVPYKAEKEIPVGKSHTNLYREGRRLYLFLKGQAPNLKPYKREMLFIELLEGIHYTEAEVLVAIKDKKLEALYPGLTYESARDAFDRLLPAEAPVKAKPVKLAIPDVDFVMAKEAEVAVPLEQPQAAPKEKKPLTEKQRLGLLKAQEARRANAAAARAAKEASTA